MRTPRSSLDRAQAAEATIQRVQELCDEEIPRGAPYGVFAKRVMAALEAPLSPPGSEHRPSIPVGNVGDASEGFHSPGALAQDGG